MNILFSPIGHTDPISNYRDGALLHICRYYDIDKIYLYMSKEMYENHCRDNRYLYCLDKIYEAKGKKYEYELKKREDLVDVHIFDYFIDEFRDIIKEISKTHPNDKLYLNISSGTPGMKSALQVLSALCEFELIPIQVATPEKKSNPHVEEKINYNAEEQWECNDDNARPENRCSVSGNISFLSEIKKQMLAELINQYDYVGAKTLADTMENSLNEDFIKLLDAAVKRYRLNFNKAKQIFKEYSFNVLEAEQSDFAGIVEYFLLLDIKKRKGEYADFLRAITPLVADLFEKILKERYRFNVSDFVRVRDIRRWDINKLGEKEPAVKQVLDTEYKGINLDSSPVYSDHLVTIIFNKSSEQNVITLCSEIRDIEKKVRNLAAHEIVSVSDEWIEKRTGFNTKRIIEKLGTLLRFTKIKLSDDFINSYDRMNKFLLKKL